MSEVPPREEGRWEPKATALSPDEPMVHDAR